MGAELMMTLSLSDLSKAIRAACVLSRLKRERPDPNEAESGRPYSRYPYSRSLVILAGSEGDIDAPVHDATTFKDGAQNNNSN
jgi:hypothetical protein